MRFARFGMGTGPIYLHNVFCMGNETRLAECQHNASNDCFHYEDAGVMCPGEYVNSCMPHNHTYIVTHVIPVWQRQSVLLEFLLDVCSEGDVRLCGGRNSAEGRVEICFNNQWGRVCDRSWSNSDSNVVCRQLGFSSKGTQIIVYY